MNDYQAKALSLVDCLEKCGYHITEIIDAAGFLQLYVDGERKSLIDLVKMAGDKR